MIDSEHIKDLVIDFNVALIKAKGSETIEEAVKHLKIARECIEKLEKVIPEMKQEELDLTQDLYNKLKPGEKPYVKKIKLT
jgi:hypothetical protein